MVVFAKSAVSFMLDLPWEVPVPWTTLDNSKKLTARGWPTGSLRLNRASPRGHMWKSTPVK